jgi:predicted nucleic acid-binding protein
MVVISDTSPISNLMHIELIHLLQNLYSEVIIPVAVYEELSVIPQQQSIIDQQNWISIRSVENQERVEELLLHLDRGESEAIVLAQESQADLLLIDELKGRSIANQKAIRTIGLLGVLIEAKENKLVNQVKPLLDQLIDDFQFRVHPKLYSRVLSIVDEQK